MPDATPQGYAIELYFDAQTEKKILVFRESIYQLGVTPVLGKLDDRPHISLAVFGQQDPQKLIDIAASFSPLKTPLPVRLEAVGAFPTDSNVVFLLPVPSFELLKIHQDFHEILEKEKVHSSHYYLPDHWVPHCTIESALSDDQLNLAIQLCKKLFTPITGCLTAVGVIAFRPLAYLAEFPLSIQDKI